MHTEDKESISKTKARVQTKRSTSDMLRVLFCNNAKDETKLHWRSDITDAPEVRSALLAQDSCLLCKKELTAEKHMAVVYMYTSIWIGATGAAV